MNSITQFVKTDLSFTRADHTIHNLNTLNLPENSPHLRVLWMYPDSLPLHGGRGDLMALLRFATALELPVEIHRINNLTDPVPLDEADMLYFCSGDLTSMPDIAAALLPIVSQLAEFGAQGKMILANGSTGAILGRDLTFSDGKTYPGLGLLNMHWIQRSSVHGDDLWMEVLDGLEVIGNEIKTADITLDPGQAPFGTVRYGRGNCGDGYEGAITGNVIYTGCLGPLLVRNPQLAAKLLIRAAETAGITPKKAELSTEDIRTELAGMEAAKKFIENKMNRK